MKRHAAIFVFALVLGCALSTTVGRAQSAANTLQSKVSLRQEAAAPDPLTSSDSDLGDIDVVQRFPKPETFTFSTSQQFFYTDNVFYTNTHEVGSTAYLGSYTASFVPYSLRDWTPRISLQYNMARYGSAASGDFDNENAAFSSQYVFSDDRQWSWTATVNASRFTAPHSGDHEFYKEIVYDNQITHVNQVIKDFPLFFIAAYDLAYHQANPSQFDRLDNTLSFSLAYYPIPEISIGPFVRPGVRIYFTDGNGQDDRHDFNLSEGIDVTWTPVKYFSMSADFSRSDNYSNNSALSYGVSTPGVSVTGTLKF